MSLLTTKKFKGPQRLPKKTADENVLYPALRAVSVTFPGRSPLGQALATASPNISVITADDFVAAKPVRSFPTERAFRRPTGYWRRVWALVSRWCARCHPRLVCAGHRRGHCQRAPGRPLVTRARGSRPSGGLGAVLGGGFSGGLGGGLPSRPRQRGAHSSPSTILAWFGFRALSCSHQAHSPTKQSVSVGIPTCFKSLLDVFFLRVCCRPRAPTSWSGTASTGTSSFPAFALRSSVACARALCRRRPKPCAWASLPTPPR